MWFRTDVGEIINLNVFAGVHLQRVDGPNDEFCIVAEPIMQSQAVVILTAPMPATNALMIIDQLAKQVKAIHVRDEPEIPEIK